MEVIIEKLEKCDLEEAITIYDKNHSLTTNYNKLLDVYDTIYNNTAYHNIVAKVNGKIVGLATVIINYDIVDQLKPFLTVWNFGVKQEFRRNKIGTKMFEYIEEFARKNNCSFVSLIAEKNNKIAQAFYSSLGYSEEIGYVKMI
ncbi:MAG: GNAT family N-acetyltransferase [Clostridia bacterium]|nr:GNAT family N-acetyltransferase [Clostridia bacterium]